MKTYQELVIAARAGGRGAFDELMIRFRPMTLSMARRYLGDDALAEDAVQEAFLTAYLKLDQLKNPTAFPSWIKAIIYSTCRSMRKANVEETLIMISYRRIHINGTGPWSVNNAQLRDPVSGQRDNPALVNTVAGEKLGLKDGDMVTVASRTGSVRMPVKLTEHIRPDCIGFMHGFGATVGRVGAGAGVCDNELIPDAGSHLDWQDLIGGEAHVSSRVRIGK